MDIRHLGGSGLLLLCSLALSISTLPPIPSAVYRHLSNWWMREDRTSLSGIADKACERLLPQQPKQKFLENKSPIQNTAVSHQTASPIAATESPDQFSPLPESEKLATTSIQTNCSQHANEKGRTTAQGYPVSHKGNLPVGEWNYAN
ncbi:uncharacterized protein CIMG_12164 [Coccidioides immitis RS]|uniref:Uncharacterized protein n=1 Tax=Coccidioides immitis (strain RS) TaxID=246410 RepID=A0A0D8JU09_COCIM|nr:uncharacterized protein CIMG_12164 [Coccidioides immitis RS]KJF60772.1 hypothetical protein CIMG_12164 [Coccidioides immitis RS]